ncbi:HipA family kinase [Aquincola sp. J276]|uniref:HipA family kinase n=1 Tax=Aquincola sp. J276 TaxID=2898432 RepID=UPI0021751BA6
MPNPPTIRTIAATRYVTPLREGGSLPAVVEACDQGLYVLKFRGAGQGPRALIAELVAGELARAVGLRVPEIVFMQLDPEMARTEPDPEIQDLIRASAGLNLALDYLPGSVTFDPLVQRPDADEASAVVWHDAFTTNIDRTPRNANLLLWHRRLWLIDHGAALFFHHDWNDYLVRATSAFAHVKDHVLLPHASRLAEADARLGALLDEDVIRAIVDLIPDQWLGGDVPFASIAEHRDAYLQYFCRRLKAPRAFAAEAVRAHAALNTAPRR